MNIPTTLLDAIMILVLSILAAAMVIWFFVMRRRVLKLIRNVTVDLEKYFKPVDKNYILLGYIVGYRAVYDLSNGDKLYIVLTTTPKYSLLYYLILLLTRRRDRLHLALKPYRRFVFREVHAVYEGDKRLHQKLLSDLGKRVESLSKDVIEVNEARYIVYHKSPDDLELVKRLLQESKVFIYKLSAYEYENLVEVIADISSGNAVAVAEILKDFSRAVTRAVPKQR